MSSVGESRRGPGVGTVVVLLASAAVVGLVGNELFVLVFGTKSPLQLWSTVFVAVVLQALPFLGLGVLLSGLLAVYVPDRVVARALPRRQGAAVPVAAAAGAVLPGCECSSVPVAARMVDRGVAAAPALAFLLSSPAINPVVLVATAVAFPNQPGMVAARAVASLGTAVVVGLVWARFGRGEWTRRPARPSRPDERHATRWHTFVATVQHDFLHAGGYLAVGAAFAATFNAVIDPHWSLSIAGVPVVSVLVCAVLAVLLAVCSEADAFVAASLVGFSPTAKLAFMVVGPMVDIKLAAMQYGSFGSAFTRRFAPLTFAVAVLVSMVVGLVLP